MLVKPPAFTYHRPRSLDEALDTLAGLGADGKVLAGGQSLVPLMSMRLAAPAHLVDINHVADLDRIEVDGEAVRVGALARHSDVERNEQTYEAVPLLRQALRQVAHPTIRNRGTTVGSLVHGDPAAEAPAVLCLLDGSVTLRHADGSRDVPAAEFFTGPFSTALEPGEILTEVRFPRRAGGHAFVEYARTHGNFALVGVAAVVELDGGTVVRAALALSGVAGTPVRATAAEQALLGTAADADAVARAVEAGVAGLSPSGDLHGSPETRIDIARSYLRRGITLACSRAGDRR
jgi:carbon-monoxide dehydrogenase medium subunit